MSNELKLCPFCGGKRLELWHCGPVYHVVCNTCGAMSGGGGTEAEAVKLWNQRKEGEDDGVQDSACAPDQ